MNTQALQPTAVTRQRRPTRLVAIAGLAMMLSTQAAWAQSESADRCGNPFVNHFGPFDYRTASAENKKLVEHAHFTPAVEALIGGVSTSRSSMAGDVGYTLHVFPNHHRALFAMQRLGERDKTDKPVNASFTVECYYLRAIRFRPDDTVARGLYALYLIKQKRKDDALANVNLMLEQAGDSPFTHYSIGQIYLELGDYDRALTQAHKARSLGLQRKELEDALRRAGHWQEPAN